jgi:predicted kinase
VIVFLAGLPGAGKSTIARGLRDSLNATVLNKDEVRAALFPGSATTYSEEQDDFCVKVMMETVAFLLGRDADRLVIFDGRTFTRRTHVEVVRDAAEAIAAPHTFIECVCSVETALTRLEQDRRNRTHLARNREPALYWELRRRAEPLAVPRLVVSTDIRLPTTLWHCQRYLASLGCSTRPGEQG